MTTQPPLSRTTPIPFQAIQFAMPGGAAERADTPSRRDLGRLNEAPDLNERLKESSDDFDAKLRDQVGDSDQIQSRREENAAAADEQRREAHARDNAKKKDARDRQLESVEETSFETPDSDPVEAAILDLLAQRPHPPANTGRPSPQHASNNASNGGSGTQHAPSDAGTQSTGTSLAPATSMLGVLPASPASQSVTPVVLNEPAARVNSSAALMGPDAKSPKDASQANARKATAQSARSATPKPVAPQIMRGMMSLLSGKGGMIMLKLQPEALGTVRVNMQIKAGSVSVRLQAETPEARRLLSESMDVLRRGLQQQGYKVEQITVQSISRNDGGSESGANNSNSDDHAGSRSGQRHDAGSGASRGRADDDASSGRRSRGDRRAASDEIDEPVTFENLVESKNDTTQNDTATHVASTIN